MGSDRTRLARADATSTISAWIREDIVEGIGQLQQRLKKLQSKALELVAGNAELQGKLDLLCTIPGIAATSGVQILSELCVLPLDMRPRQWVAHAGLDPRHHESGMSINKAVRISKAGNKYLRRALFMPALTALRQDPHVAAFFEDLVGRGKARLQAVVAVMRKLLHAIWGMLKSSTAWEGGRFYGGPMATPSPTPPIKNACDGTTHISASPDWEASTDVATLASMCVLPTPVSKTARCRGA